MEGKADALESTKPCGLLAGGASVVVIIVVIINATNFIYCGMGSFRMEADSRLLAREEEYPYCLGNDN